MRVGGALCVALVVAGCRAGALDAGAAGHVAAATDGGTGPGTDAGGVTMAAPACVPPSPAAIRLLAPQSGATVTSARPSFRWTEGTGPYRLEACADRACHTVQLELLSDRTETALPDDLPAGYWFWRVQGAGASWTSAWELRVRRRFPRYAPAADTSVSGFSDYDGDGYPDVAAFGAAPMIYLGGPDGLSASRVVWQAGPNGSLGTLLMEPQVDVNGDGFTDLSSDDGIGGSDGAVGYGAHIQFGADNGLAPAATFVDVFPNAYALSVDEPLGLGDFDGDGFGDLIMQSRYGAGMIRGCAPTPPDRLACGACQLQQVATGDFDGDARTDVIFADDSLINLYMGNPSKPTPIAIPGMSGLWVVDFNYDGYSDLVIDDQSPARTLRAYEGGPRGLSSTLSTAAQPTAFVLVGDFDGDGYWDTIGPDCSEGCSVAYGGPGGWGAPATRTAPLDASILFVGPPYVPDAIVVDMNADGYDDLLVSKPAGTAISWYAGSPAGLSAAPSVVLTP